MSVFDRLAYTELEEIYNTLKVLPEDTIDAGAYHNHQYNGVKNMINSYNAMIDYHPAFKRLFGD